LPDTTRPLSLRAQRRNLARSVRWLAGREIASLR